MNSIFGSEKVKGQLKELFRRKPYKSWIWLTTINDENDKILYAHHKRCCKIRDIKNIEVDGAYQIIKVNCNDKTIMIDPFSFYII